MSDLPIYIDIQCMKLRFPMDGETMYCIKFKVMIGES